MKFKNFSLLVMILGLSLAACSGDKSKDTDASLEGEVIETTEAAAAYNVLTDASTIKWSASKPGKDHTGSFALKSGSVMVAGNVIVGGSFDIDMENLIALNADGERSAYLEGHLKGSGDSNKDDFFNVSTFPTSNFKISKVTEYKAEGDPANCVIYGDLTMKGITNPVSFKATTSVENGTLTATSSEFTIDRTKWGINYDSGSVIKDLVAEKIIVDEVPLVIEIKATK